MDITPTSAATPAAPEAKVTQAATTAKSVSNDFQTFLTLLTAQMRNQDPLKPIDSTDFVAQLATFSSVEQQVKSNDKLDLIYNALSGGGATTAGLAQWVGREVRAPVAASFKGEPVAVEFDANSEAQTRVMVVRNAFDQIVLRRNVGADQTEFSWDGSTDAGGMAPHGTYRFVVENYKNEILIGQDAGSTFAAVTEVRIEDGVANLVLEGGEKTALDAVTAVR